MENAHRYIRSVSTPKGLLTLHVESEPCGELLSTAQHVEGQTYDLVDGVPVQVPSFRHSFVISLGSKKQKLDCNATSQERLDAHWANWLPASEPEPETAPEPQPEPEPAAHPERLTLSNLTRQSLSQEIRDHKKEVKESYCPRTLHTYFGKGYLAPCGEDYQLGDHYGFSGSIPSLRQIREVLALHPEAESVEVNYLCYVSEKEGLSAAERQSRDFAEPGEYAAIPIYRD